MRALRSRGSRAFAIRRRISFGLLRSDIDQFAMYPENEVCVENGDECEADSSHS